MRLSADCGGVYVDDSGVKITRGLESLVDIASVNRSGQTIRDAVGDFNSLLETVDRDDGNNGAENFFLCDTHLRRAIAKDSGSVEPTFRIWARVKTISACQKLGALVFPDFNVLHHGLELLLVDARAHVHGGVQTIADSERFDAVDESGDKFAVDALMDGNATGGCAALT